MDVLSGDELGQLIDRCRPDGIWALVHLVGGYLDGAPIADMDMGDWDLQLQLNLRSAALALRAALPSMVERGQGRAVAVSSRAARMPFAGAAAYAASKAGVIALVEAASAEVKNAGVCVNCVLPSVIDTPGNRAAQPDADPSQMGPAGGDRRGDRVPVLERGERRDGGVDPGVRPGVAPPGTAGCQRSGEAALRASVRWCPPPRRGSAARPRCARSPGARGSGWTSGPRRS